MENEKTEDTRIPVYIYDTAEESNEALGRCLKMGNVRQISRVDIEKDISKYNFMGFYSDGSNYDANNSTIFEWSGTIKGFEIRDKHNSKFIIITWLEDGRCFKFKDRIRVITFPTDADRDSFIIEISMRFGTPKSITSIEIEYDRERYNFETMFTPRLSEWNGTKEALSFNFSNGYKILFMTWSLEDSADFNDYYDKVMHAFLLMSPSNDNKKD